MFGIASLAVLTRVQAPRALRGLVRAFAFLLTLASVYGVASASGPSYVAKMPTPEQVEGKIHGSDPIDTAVRQAEALNQLCGVVRTLSRSETVNNMTAEEMAKCSAYLQAATAIAQATGKGLPSYGPQSWMSRTQHVHFDDGFRDQVLSEFPDVKALYERDKPAAQAPAVSKPVEPRSPFNFALAWLAAGLALSLYMAHVLRFVTLFVRIRGTEKAVIRKIDASATNLVPRDPDVVVDHLCLGGRKEYSHYTAPVVTTAPGQVSGGGTNTVVTVIFDFGWAVHNGSAQAIRFRVGLAAMDGDGYLLNTNYVGHDVAPGENRRMWAGLHVTKNADFKKYVLKEIGFGPAPGPTGTAQFSKKTEPGITLYDAFRLGKSPLVHGGVVQVVGALLFCLGMVVFVLGLLASLATC
jgi:hypothetical protein